MGVTTSLILIAVGAVLVWAVNYELAGVNLDAVRWILLVVGTIGALLSLFFWSSWGGFGGRRRDEKVIVERR